MTKKEYIKPEIRDMQMQVECALLAFSVRTSGLSDELSQDLDDLSGESWDEALSHRRNGNAWDEELEFLEGEQSATGANWSYTW
jgi:hypothetical protein